MKERDLIRAIKSAEEQYEKVGEVMAPRVQLTEIEAMLLDSAIKNGSVHQTVEFILTTRLGQAPEQP